MNKQRPRLHRFARNSIQIFLITALATVGRGLTASAKKPPAKGSSKTESIPLNVPSFRYEVMPELVRNCATAEGCHGNHATESVHLDLRLENAYSQLVDAPSKIRKGSMRVKRGDPKASFLLDKIEGTLNPGEGKRMPLDDQSGMPLIPSPLSTGYIDNVLKPWILGGAPDN